MKEILIAFISVAPALIAAIVSLITFFSNKKYQKDNKNSEILKELNGVKDKQIKMEEKFDYERASQARTRIIIFNNEIMAGRNHTKDYFDDIIENSIDVYESYYNSPNHKNLKNGVAKAAIKNIYRVYDKLIQTNSFLQYPKGDDKE